MDHNETALFQVVRPFHLGIFASPEVRLLTVTIFLAAGDSIDDLLDYYPSLGWSDVEAAFDHQHQVKISSLSIQPHRGGLMRAQGNALGRFN